MKLHVVNQVTSGSLDVAVSGVYFDPVNDAVLLGEDTGTQGTWSGRYGSDGKIVAGDTSGSSLPSYIDSTTFVRLPNDAVTTWAATTSDSRAPQKPSNTASRVAAAWQRSDQLTVSVKLASDLPHRLSLYFLDWNRVGLAQRLDVLDAQTSIVLASHTVKDFAEGRLVSVIARGHILLRMTALPSVKGTTGASGSSVGCGFSALYFDPVPGTGTTASVGAFAPLEDLHVQGVGASGSVNLSRTLGMSPEGTTAAAAMGSTASGTGASGATQKTLARQFHTDEP